MARVTAAPTPSESRKVDPLRHGSFWLRSWITPHYWFTWHPVRIGVRPRRWVWLRMTARRWTPNGWRYELIGTTGGEG